MVFRHKFYKFLLILLFIGLCSLIVWHFHLRTYLSVEGFKHYRDTLAVYQKAHPYLFIFFYISLYVFIITCCIPGTIIFDLLAGFIFGCFLGTLLVVGSYLTGSIINFVIVRYFFRNALEHKFGKFKRFIYGSGKYGLLLNLISLRLIAVIPFWVLNIIAALLNIRMHTFILSTFIGIIPMSIIYVLIGEGVHDSISAGQDLTVDVITNPKIWVPLFCMALILMLPNILKSSKKFRKPR